VTKGKKTTNEQRTTNDMPVMREGLSGKGRGGRPRGRATDSRATVLPCELPCGQRCRKATNEPCCCSGCNSAVAVADARPRFPSRTENRICRVLTQRPVSPCPSATAAAPAAPGGTATARSGAGGARRGGSVAAATTTFPK
jgi:hypothetical protein